MSHAKVAKDAKKKFVGSLGDLGVNSPSSSGLPGMMKKKEVLKWGHPSAFPLPIL